MGSRRTVQSLSSCRTPCWTASPRPPPVRTRRTPGAVSIAPSPETMTSAAPAARAAEAVAAAAADDRGSNGIRTENVPGTGMSYHMALAQAGKPPVELTDSAQRGTLGVQPQEAAD